MHDYNVNSIPMLPKILRKASLLWLLSLLILILYALYFGVYPGFLTFIGVCAALIANSTAAGGGVLFVPVFSYLELSTSVVVGTSILIQCFGMSAGAIKWTIRLKERQVASKEYVENIKKLLFPVLIGVASGVYLKDIFSLNLEIFFSTLSLIFASLLLLQTWMYSNERLIISFSKRAEYIIISFCAFVGGVLTPFISLGVGELVAIAMMILGRNIFISVGTGVTLASVSLLFSMPSIISSGNFDLEILLFAAPGAVIGGVLAYRITEYLGPTRLKVFFSMYVFLVSILMLLKS